MQHGPSARRIRVPKSQRAKLEAWASSNSLPYRLVVRARMILHAEDGLSNAEIARRVGCTSRTVRTWRKRWAEDPTVETLEDRLRSGRPSTISVATRCELVKLACKRPSDKLGAPFREIWTLKSLAGAMEKTTGVSLSISEVHRILSTSELRPHRVRQWLHSPDPDFTAKTKRICDLYLNPPPGAAVVCVDEKPIPIRSCLHPTHVGPQGIVRYEYEYKRHGTCALLGAFDVQDGDVYGEVVPHRTADALVEFMYRLAARYPARDVYVVWDNLNIHYNGPSKRWVEFNREHGDRFHFVYTPLHASWVNQVEVWFSILERRVLKHGSFHSYRDLRRQVLGFIQHWNRHESHPFNWTFRGNFVQTGRRRVA
jgi:transposase